MTVVTELDLPEIDYNQPGFGPATYHELLAAARERNWLAHSPLAYIVLDGESGDFFLRARQTTFPGREIAELFGITDGPLHENVKNNILNLTGDKHRRLRSLIGHAFTPKAADRWRPAMREFLAQLWGDLGGATQAEFVAAIAKPYPSRTIAAVLGAPVADADRLQHWSSMVQRQFDIAALSAQIPDIERAVVEAHEYVTRLLEERRATPGPDLISTLLAAEEQGDRLSHDECVNLVLNLLAGGVDTTQSQLSQALRLFAGHPDQWALLADRPELAPRAVEETMRYLGAVRGTIRVASEDIEYRDVLFPAGTIVSITLAGANMDPDVFATPDIFDIACERDALQMTFGSGIHFCMGAALARAELQEALPLLARRLPDLGRDGPVQWKPSTFGIWGPARLPLRFRPTT